MIRWKKIRDAEKKIIESVFPCLNKQIPFEFISTCVQEGSKCAIA